MDTIIETLQAVPVYIWAVAIIGGFVFAAVFNIPARQKLLSAESNTRKRAMRYDALNFIVFYITFPMAGNLAVWFDTGMAAPLIVNTAAFALYSISFWVVLRTYIWWKDRKTC